MNVITVLNATLTKALLNSCRRKGAQGAAAVTTVYLTSFGRLALRQLLVRVS